jgi:uncharacterized protein YcnI
METFVNYPKGFGMIKKVVAYIALVSALVSLPVGIASAHVVVKPAEVETAAFQTFTIGVPTEKDVPTTKLRLVVPQGVGHVTPTVKPGWRIDIVKDGEGEDAVVKEIVWSGGSVPAGQRDDFTFSAQAPEQTATLQWKAYQTYSDGEVVAWDQAPTAEKGHGSTPYSETQVVDELPTATGQSTATDSDTSSGSGLKTSIALGLSVVAVLISVYALTTKR